MAEAHVMIAGVAVQYAIDGILDAHDLRPDPADAMALLTRGLAPTRCSPRIHCRVRSRSSAAVPEAGVYAFDHFGIRVSRTAAGWLLRDGPCWVEVDISARAIDAHIPAGRTHLAGFFRTTLFVALVLLLREEGLFHLHAGLAVRRSPTSQAVLVVGTSGTGKTTTTLALREGGFTPLADDAVFLSGDGAYAVARPFHATPATQRAFPNLQYRGVVAAKAEVEVALPYVDPVSITDLLFLNGPCAQTLIAQVDGATAMGRLLEESAILIVHGATHVDAHLGVLRKIASNAHARTLAAGPEWLGAGPVATLFG